MRSKHLAFVACLLFGGCAFQYEPREGRPLPERMPQAKEQCRAQPDLDWCRHGR